MCTYWLTILNGLFSSSVFVAYFTFSKVLRYLGIEQPTFPGEFQREGIGVCCLISSDVLACPDFCV